MSWTDIHKDDYGWVGQLCVTQDGAAQDISSFTTLQFVLLSPHGETSTKTAEFTSDGEDGYLQYQFQDGDIDAAGTWKVAARLSKTDYELMSDDHSFYVEARID